MQVLIDCGFHKGENIAWFINRYYMEVLEEYGVHAKALEWKIYGFEPNPLLKWDREIKGVEVIKKAVSDHNGIEKFYVTKFEKSSSLYKKRSTPKVDNSIVKEVDVECIDLCEWIVNNIDKKDRVFLKLDVEGEEYKIVPKLLEKGLFEEYINEMYVEWHNKSLRDGI